MSRICALTGKRRMSVNTISIERSQVTKRHPGFSYPNLHLRSFNSVLGTISLRLCNKALRSIEKQGDIDSYLINVKAGHLTPEFAIIRKRVIKAKGHVFTVEKKETPVNNRKLKKQQAKLVK